MPTTTSRLALTQPVGTDPASELRTSITGNATTLDAAAMYQSGTFAARPASPVAGTFYYATDTTALYVYSGSAWQLVTTNGGGAPVGTVQQFAAASVPADPDGVTRWKVCDGSAISRTTYASLFSLLSTTYGAGDGSTTFNIPDMRGRVPVGADPGGVHLPSNHPSLGASSGEEQHTLTTGEAPVHSHTTVDNDAFVATCASGSFGFFAGPGYTSGSNPLASIVTVGGISNHSQTGNAGSGGAHNNLQPYLAVNHIIKVL